jgi:large subunit ribosomal protein L19
MDNAGWSSKTGRQAAGGSCPRGVLYFRTRHWGIPPAACNFLRIVQLHCAARQDTKMKPHILEAIAGKDNPNIPALRPGDNVSVHVRIKEGTKERVQEFKGTVIRMRRGENSACFTVRRVASHSIGVERTFLMRSPRIEKVELLRSAIVRRAKLYYLRTLTGKKARLKARRSK